MKCLKCFIISQPISTDQNCGIDPNVDQYQALVGINRYWSAMIGIMIWCGEIVPTIFQAIPLLKTVGVCLSFTMPHIWRDNHFDWKLFVTLWARGLWTESIDWHCDRYWSPQYWSNFGHLKSVKEKHWRKNEFTTKFFESFSKNMFYWGITNYSREYLLAWHGCLFAY